MEPPEYQTAWLRSRPEPALCAGYRDRYDLSQIAWILSFAFAFALVAMLASGGGVFHVIASVLILLIVLGLIYGYSTFVVVPRVCRLVHDGAISSATILDRWERTSEGDDSPVTDYFIAYRFTASTPDGVREVVRAEQTPKSIPYIRPAIGEVVPVYYLPDDPQHCLLAPFVKHVLGDEEMRRPPAQS